MKCKSFVLVTISFIALWFPTTAIAKDDWQLFKKVCIDNLYRIEKAKKILIKRGWKNLGISRKDDVPMMKNLFSTGLLESNSELFLSKDRMQAIAIGQADNDTYPNHKCYYTTSNQTVDIGKMVGGAQAIFKSTDVVIKTGSQFKNKNYNWWVGHWEGNLSTENPFAEIQINHYPNKIPTTNTFFNISIVGMLPRAQQ